MSARCGAMPPPDIGPSAAAAAGRRRRRRPAPARGAAARPRRSAPVTGDDTVELGQRLDLVDDDARASARWCRRSPAAIRGCRGGVPRASSRAHAASRRPSAACPAASRRSAAWSARTCRGSRRCAGCRCRAAFARTLAFLLEGRAPSALESATTRAISRARPAAPSSDSSSRLENRLSRPSISLVRVSSVATSASIPARRSAKVVSAGGCSGRSTRPLPQGSGVGVELGGELAKVRQRLVGDVMERVDVLLDLA